MGILHKTKFISIIRYEHNLKKGKYRFNKIIIYSKYLIKDGNTTENEDSTKNKIIEINKKDIVSKDFFNDIFLFETNICLINATNANYVLLRDIDFFHVPGLY